MKQERPSPCPFGKILIANRGEIAVRVIRACRELGIASVALYTAADRSWLARYLADEAVHIGAGPAAQSYIDFDKVIDAAGRTGVDAIHPGYGFLAENSEFARRCADEGIVFIGPSAEVIDLMGNKARAKDIVAGLGVPVIPGCDGEVLTDDELLQAATGIGCPLMIKAVAGGGGMGMRIVKEGGAFTDALASVRREAKAAFGDDRVLIERYFPAVRHIEVQVLADAHGNAVHLFERECSVQRRRQKVVEESPSPFVSQALRERLCAASLKIVEAVGYEGVGTIEFIVVDDAKRDQFFFLEMNTRLQVEHGVTEAVTGVDLVRAQIAVAEGRSLSMAQSDISLRGHAIECRLCAEDPARGFQPVTGTVLEWAPPECEGIRVDTGLKPGTGISVYYDSLVAKLIATGDTREDALRRMRSALGRTVLLGLETNQRFLKRIMADECFAEGGANTGYIERNEASLLAPPGEAARDEAALIGALVSALDETKHLGPGQGGAFTRDYDIGFDGEDSLVRLSFHGGTSWSAVIGERRFELSAERDGDRLRVAIGGVEKSCRARVAARHIFVHLPGEGSIVLTRGSTLSEETQDTGSQGYCAMMAGQVVAILTSPGATIKPGEKLMVIESMKMEHAIVAQSPGVIDQICVSKGVAVQAGATLLTLVADDKEARP